MSKLVYVVGVLSGLLILPDLAEATDPPDLCPPNQAACTGVLADDAAAENASGGIGSKKGTGGAGTNAIRPFNGITNPPISAPIVLPMPSIPRRFGF